MVFELNNEIISKARENMNKLVDNLISLKIEDLETYEFPLDHPFGLEIINGNALFYLIIRFSSDNNNLICMNPGAFDRDRYDPEGNLIEPPYFSRWSWYKYFEESVIITADPMIFRDSDVKLGWMIGERDQWYIETLSAIIKKLAINQNVINDNMLFFGSSAGGFISICLATLLKNSKVLVNNSQLSVLDYSTRLLNKALDTVAPTFEGLTNEEIISQYEYRINVSKLFERENYAPRITYYVNAKSNPDVNVQSLPFIKKYSKQEQFTQLNIIYYNEEKEKTHNPLPNRPTINIIRLFTKNFLYNSEPDLDKEIIREEKYAKQLEREIKQLKKDNQKLNKRNEKLQNEKNKLKKDNKKANKRNEKLKSANQDLKNKISEMENSNSWKVTRPLRNINRIRK